MTQENACESVDREKPTSFPNQVFLFDWLFDGFVSSVWFSNFRLQDHRDTQGTQEKREEITEVALNLG